MCRFFTNSLLISSEYSDVLSGHYITFWPNKNIQKLYLASFSPVHAMERLAKSTMVIGGTLHL